MKSLIIVLAILVVASGAWGAERYKGFVEYKPEEITATPNCVFDITSNGTEVKTITINIDTSELEKRITKLEKEVEELRNRPYIHRWPEGVTTDVSPSGHYDTDPSTGEYGRSGR